MRDDDDHIRQFMPVLRRIIILVAVLTAIPVAMWTITAFVRTYVGPPQTPTFQRMADATAASSTADAAATPSDNGTTGTTQSPPVLEAKATDAGGNAPPPDANAAAPEAGAVTSAAPANAAPQIQPSMDAASPNAAAPDTAVAPTNVMQTSAATDAAPVDAASTAATPDAANPPGTSPSGRSGPPAYATPSDAAAGGMQVATQQQQPANWPAPSADAVDSLPPSLPIAGPIPLPRNRPKTFVLAQAGIPLPVPRPDAAGPDAPAAPATPFDWLQHLFHPASATPAPPPSDNADGYADTPH